MRVVTDYEEARSLAGRLEAVFYSSLKAPFHQRLDTDWGQDHVIGRRYPGLFDEQDGSYIAVTKDADGTWRIDRDAYGAIPVYFSNRRPLVSTDIRLILDVDRPEFDREALSEYLSCAYLTTGKSVYSAIRCLSPDEVLICANGALRTTPKRIFAHPPLSDYDEASRLLEGALENSIVDLLGRCAGPLLLNLSGGTDSTLLLAKLREAEPGRPIVTNTYFHEDWRDDIDDRVYAELAARRFGSQHRLIRINNESFCRAHLDLVKASHNVFHTYAPAFYIQNQAACEGTSAIVNGSGPDESMIGTEKVPVRELAALARLGRNEWVDYLIERIDYIKLPEEDTGRMLLGRSAGFLQSRRRLAAKLLDAPDFVEFQRRYHALTILQDHVQELSTVAQVLGAPIVFPYLTNDVFRIVFSTPFDLLNAGGVYKALLKAMLARFMPTDFVHRQKIGFQSPSRPYFHGNVGLGRELAALLARQSSRILDLARVRPAITQRLDAAVDLRARYDYLEWTSYNVLLLEEMQKAHA